GESMDARLQQQGKLPIAAVLRIGREIALGLAAAHEQGLIHRDVKPSNIWLEARTDRVKILDFGLARPAAAPTLPAATPSPARAPDQTESHAPDLTHLGQIVGTPAYMSPEQVESRPLDQRCDLFSLGCVLYTLCTGEEPFKGPNIPSILRAVCQATPVSPR